MPYKDKEAAKASQHRYAQRHPERIKAKNKRNYKRRGNTDEQRAKRRAWKKLPLPTRPAPENCECCGKPPDTRQSLHLDHDHQTGKFRGWLCASCNLGIGKLGDNANALFRALDYLNRADLT
ncbi:MAG TPA: endonuclease domain-containing protein [Steroidobacteraceae bacterium]|jgi:hypothetical protein|nr:endonuclease domain-containing protein [Steroidobacteraceae bacterium]